MSWLVEKEKGKYRFWSTICDDWLSDWMTREEALNWLENMKKKGLKREMDKERDSFPDGWCNKKGKYYNEAVRLPKGA